MAHNIGTTSDGLRSFAFRGNREDIWHRLGNQYQDGWTIEDWARNSGLNWTAFKVPAYADMSAIGHASKMFDAAPNFGGMTRVEDRFFIARGDNGYILHNNAVSNLYQIHQPLDQLEVFAQFISNDPRFQIDTAMCLKHGEIVAVNATFNDGDMTIAGDKHKARLLSTTTFDGSGSSLGKGIVERTVCNNTLDVGLAEKGGPVIKIRHTKKFDPKVVGQQLATVIKGFAKYKAMGEYMSCRKFSESDVSKFFKLTLDIDLKATENDISTKKMNQFRGMRDAYHVGTRTEGLEPNTAWSMMQAVTRYVDHDKAVKVNGMGEHEARFVGAQFGTGAAMKAAAVSYLDDMCDGELLRAVATKTATDGDVSALLKTPFRSSFDK